MKKNITLFMEEDIYIQFQIDCLRLKRKVSQSTEEMYKVQSDYWRKLRIEKKEKEERIEARKQEKP